MGDTAVHSAWRWSAALAVGVLGMAALETFAVATPAEADLRQTLDAIYQKEALQRELPQDAPRKPTVGFAGAPNVFFMLLTAVALILLAAWLANADWERWGEKLSARRGRARKEGGTSSPSTRADWHREADLLAANGQCAEAIHLLLAAALAELAAGAAHWPNAATAREIAALPFAGSDLRALVAAAELAHFGGREATQAHYRECRACAVRIEASRLRDVSGGAAAAV